ncbi:hypothetical protein M3Y94_01137200 [Aphelenchoides besseyi]|nr:hypothetical protein M3Y94_01137200 [Aphelenchoides besseyi]KAI6227829.1 hypothetical protein M3Y95_00557900 [Aphelenchoides besseyi]
MDTSNSSLALNESYYEPEPEDYFWQYQQKLDVSREFMDDVWLTVNSVISYVCEKVEQTRDYNAPFDRSSHQRMLNERIFQSEPIIIDGGVISSDEEWHEGVSNGDSDAEIEVLERNSKTGTSSRAADVLDLDRIVEAELKQMTANRQTRRKARKEPNRNLDISSINQLFRSSLNLSETTSLGSNDKQIQTTNDPVMFEVVLSDCCKAISMISERMSESTDDVKEYRLASSLYMNSQLLRINEHLNWRVNALSNGLKRALTELILFRSALESTVDDLRKEIELLRKNTLGSIRRIVEGDIRRHEQMQQKWEEVQTYIKRKNRRITELTEQLNGADFDVGILLASHKERIEAACIAERNYFRVSEKVDDLEVELEKKNKMLVDRKCPRCESNNEETEQEKRAKEERLKRREEQRKKMEDNERQKFACAERYEKAIQQHVDSKMQDLTNSTLPWHKMNENDGDRMLQNQPQSSNAFPTQGNQNFVPFAAFRMTELRLEQAERSSEKQERMNTVMSRELTDCKAQITKLKSENMNLTEKVKTLTVHLDKWKEANRNKKIRRSNSKAGTIGEMDTPPDSNSSDKSKDERTPNEETEETRKGVLPQPPMPPNLEQTPSLCMESPRPVFNAAQREIQQIDEQLKHLTERRMQQAKMRTEQQQSLEQRIPPSYSQPVVNSNQPVKRFFPTPIRSTSPDRQPKRPALGPPPLMPPIRRSNVFEKPGTSFDKNMDRSFYDDFIPREASFRQNTPDHYHRDYSPPSSQFEHARQESWVDRNSRGDIMLPKTPGSGWRHPTNNPIHQPFIPRSRPFTEPRQLSHPVQRAPSFHPPNMPSQFIRPPMQQQRPKTLPWYGRSDNPRLPSPSTSWIISGRR